MSGIEKDLDPVIDQFKRNRDEIADKSKKEREASIARSDEFKSLFKNIVYPIMVDCVQYLDKKGEEFKYSRINIGKVIPEIGFEMSSSAEIIFSMKDDKVKIVEKPYKGADTEILIEKTGVNHRFCKK